MLKKVLKIVFVSLLVLGNFSCKNVSYVSSKPLNYLGDKEQAQVLRRSVLWNGAWASRNLASLFELFSPDAQFASAGGKWTGTEEGMKKFSALLKKRPDLQWVTRPKEVIVNEDWQVALESGDWTEWWKEPDGMVTIRGSYVLMWKKTKGEPWLIHSALFVPLSCSGQSQYCKPHEK